MIIRRGKIFLIVVLMVASTSFIYSQGKSNEELVKAAQNPIANMMSIPFQNNTSFNFGPYDRTQNVLNIQPVCPLQKEG